MNKQSSPDDIRAFRKAVFLETVSLVTAGSYTIDGELIDINSIEVLKHSTFFYAPPELEPRKPEKSTSYTVIEADCLETAQLLLDMGEYPCVLNMASGRNPGGGVLNGAGAQEENIFRRTNLFRAMYQFADYAEEYGLERSPHQYPLNRNTGGVYSDRVTIFRASENNGYALLQNPYQCAFVSVPAISHPELEEQDGLLFLARHLVEPTKEKMRTILRIAGQFTHSSLVLSAFGCGAFGNPPHHIARLFQEVFNETEFRNRFKTVVFSIIDDHNSHKDHNPDGNVLPFLKVFQGALI
jgi:uncharacterized protein (TIGR02452 family)